MTTECGKCHHKFLKYAVTCPECGWARPKRRKVNKAMIASLALAAAALWMTLVFGSAIKKRDEMPFRPSQSATLRRY